MLDTLCQCHDLVNLHRPHLLEKDGDKEFVLMLDYWSKANTGNGWTGLSYFEKQKIIPLIKDIFALKDAVGSESPYKKASLPSVLRDLFIDYNDFIQDPYFFFN
jgi:hypothetical protein